MTKEEKLQRRHDELVADNKLRDTAIYKLDECFTGLESLLNGLDDDLMRDMRRAAHRMFQRAMYTSNEIAEIEQAAGQ